MPIAEDSLIAPAKLDARPPLKKSTVGWIVGTVLGLAVIGIAAPSLFTAHNAAPIPEPGATNGQPGDVNQIDIELSKARDRAKADAADKAQAAKPAAVASAAVPPLPEGVQPRSGEGVPVRPVVPPSAKRDDNSGALYGETGKSGSDPVEYEAGVRTSPSIKFDAGSSDGKTEGALGSVADAVTSRIRALTGTQPPAAAASSEDAAAKNRERVLSALESQQKSAQATTGVNIDRMWLREIGTSVERPTPLRSYKVTNPYTLMQGKTIPAVLTRELNSDLPGLVSACTTTPVYDSLSGENLLIPRGSCLQGQYSNLVANGQERILFAFTRLMLPDGTGIDLPGNPGADLVGAAGVAGDVNNHFFKMFGTSLIVAVLGDWAERGKTVVQTNGTTGGPATAAGQVLVDVSRSILQRNQNIPPTITIAKGTRIVVEVTRDMEFQGPYRERTSR